MSRIVCIASWLATFSAAVAQTPTWSAYGPGTLSVQPVAEKGPRGDACVRIVFKPDRQHGGDYWCGARIDLPALADENLLTFYAKTLGQDTLQGIKISDDTGQAGVYMRSVPADWIEIRVRREFPDWLQNPQGAALKNIARVELIYNNNQFKPGTTFTMLVSGLKTTSLKPRPYFHPLWMPEKTPAPVAGCHIETCIHNVWDGSNHWGRGDAEFTGLDTPQGMAVARDVVEHLIKEYGHVGVTIAYLSDTNGKAFTDYFASIGGMPLAEGHNFPGDEFLKEHNAYAINIHGQRQTSGDRTHCEDMTNPIVLKALQERMLAAAKAGAKAWRSVDYVWPYEGGPTWGYSDSAIKRWRENLNGTDSGIEIIEDGKHRVASFWEYAESYLGYRMTPGDCGYASWSEYHPPRKGELPTLKVENRRTLFNLFFHYEWVKYINEAARPSAPYGLLAQPICNPESFDNGTDLAWLFRAAFVRGMASEWWNSADVVVWNYYTGGYYDRIARKNDKEIVLLGESAANGGSPYYGKFGRPNYWDNMANYLITYAQAGSIDVKGKHDQYWGSSWKRASDPKEREYQSFTAFRSAWCGFLQCRNDQAFKPKSSVLAITNRPIVSNSPSFDRTPAAIPSSLGRDLMTLNYLHDSAALPVELAYDLNDYRTIVYSPLTPPKGYAQKLAAWLASGDGDRTLITHSVVPTRYLSAERAIGGLPPTSIQPGTQHTVLGFESIRIGTKRSGMLKSHEKTFSRVLAEFEGKRVSLSANTYTAPGGTVLVSLDGESLVSERRCGQGRVIYLHFAPNEQGLNGRRIERAIVDAVMRYVGHMPIATSPESIHVMRFDAEDGRKIYMTFNMDARTDMDHHGETFSVYQAADTEIKGQIEVITGEPTTTYTLTNLITGESNPATSDKDGMLPVRFDGWNMMGFSLQKGR